MCVWLKLFKTLALQSGATIFENQKDNKRVFIRKNHTFSKEASTFSNQIQGRARLANDQNKEHKVSEEKKSLITFCSHSLGSSAHKVFQQVLERQEALVILEPGMQPSLDPAPNSEMGMWLHHSTEDSCHPKSIMGTRIGPPLTAPRGIKSEDSPREARI